MASAAGERKAPARGCRLVCRAVPGTVNRKKDWRAQARPQGPHDPGRRHRGGAVRRDPGRRADLAGGHLIKDERLAHDRVWLELRAGGRAATRAPKVRCPEAPAGRRRPGAAGRPW